MTDQELLVFFIREIQRELENKSSVGFIPQPELTALTKEILSLLAKSTVKRYTEY